ncbi:hypothetical protein CPLU01_08062 [Colletotrichum plurivorum]|uniref:Uncharacterized protein n=1 Tax=Colletotrichum plurivorum TaxID=2175906 RepID=A0A8H6ND53_9PEZI|nr:hypothetical protein CPLU01_08062 [Colletotrichum plurivorum]
MSVEIDFNFDPRTRFKHQSRGVEACNVETWRPLDNGQVVTVHAERLEDLPDPEILDLQAKLITAWALTAGADPPKYPFAEYDDDLEQLQSVLDGKPFFDAGSISKRSRNDYRSELK